jgi:hypothetical protein
MRLSALRLYLAANIIGWWVKKRLIRTLDAQTWFENSAPTKFYTESSNYYIPEITNVSQYSLISRIQSFLTCPSTLRGERNCLQSWIFTGYWCDLPPGWRSMYAFRCLLHSFLLFRKMFLLVPTARIIIWWFVRTEFPAGGKLICMFTRAEVPLSQTSL